MQASSAKQLYVHEAGPHDAPAIVFLHGGGVSGRMWQPQLERLPNYYCLVPDLSEQGQSVHIAPFTLDGSAQQVAALIRTRCRNRRAHLVGLSLGGAVALTVLRLTPDLVDHVVVSGTAAGIGRVLGTMSKANARLSRYLNMEMLVKVSIKQFGIPPEHQAMFRDDMLRGATEAFILHYTAALMAMRLPTHTTAPTLVAVGQRETWVAKQAARKIVTTVPHARGVVAPQVGHMWSLQNPNLFTNMVRAWCKDRPLPAALQPLE